MTDADLQVVVLEDDQDQWEIVREQLSTVFMMSRLSWQPTWVRRARDCMEHLSMHPNLVICDVNLGETRELEGLELIAKAKTRYPDIVFAACTRQHVDIREVGQHYPAPDLVISKIMLAQRDDYKKHIGEQLQRLLRRSVILTTDVDDGQPELLDQWIDQIEVEPAGEKLSPRLFQVLLEQVTFIGHGSSRFDRVTLRRLGGGLSDFLVLEIKLFQTGLTFGVPGVMKISKISDALAERYNYEKYVKWCLPYSWRVDLIGEGEVRGYGAVCYSFAMAGGNSPLPLTVLLGRGSRVAIDLVIEKLFGESITAWYEPRSTDAKDLGLHLTGPLYFPKLDLHSRAAKFMTDSVEMFRNHGVTTNREKDDAQSELADWTDPEVLLTTNRWGPVPLCICHGDLNSNNVLIDPATKQLSLIDFTTVGLNYLFRDFVFLETSIRLEYAIKDCGDEDLADLTMGEMMILEGGWNGNTTAGPIFLEPIAAIRKAASRRFKSEPFRSYVLCVVAHQLRLVTRRKGWGVAQKRRLIASQVASISWLMRARAGR